MVSTFLNRETFAYGISSFDEVIQTTQLPQSFILYQEMIMSALVYAGFPVAETYTIIKAISKKKQEVITLLKDRFIAGFKKQITNREKTESSKQPKPQNGFGRLLRTQVHMVLTLLTLYVLRLTVYTAHI